MSKTRTDDRMYTDTPCDKCGGPTLQIGQGSIWCPNEGCVPGGHFVVRAAFARPPVRDANGEWTSTPPTPTKRHLPTPIKSRSKPKDDGFDLGLDGFVKSDR